MANITVSRDVTASPAAVWKVLDDFGGVHRFSAGVERSPLVEGAPANGVGAERICRLYDGNHISERVTESITQKRLSIEVFDTSMPIKTARASFTLDPTPTGGTRVTMTSDYVVKYGPIGKAMDALMMKKMMTGSLDRLLAGLDHHLETGEAISEGWAPIARGA